VYRKNEGKFIVFVCNVVFISLFLILFRLNFTGKNKKEKEKLKKKEREERRKREKEERRKKESEERKKRD
jgi:hypothetical protein